MLFIMHVALKLIVFIDQNSHGLFLTAAKIKNNYIYRSLG